MGKHTRSKKGRSGSHYRDRLAARGLTKAPVMPSIEWLRKKQPRVHPTPPVIVMP